MLVLLDIYFGIIIIEHNKLNHNIQNIFTCLSFNVMHAIICQQLPSTFYSKQADLIVCDKQTNPNMESEMAMFKYHFHLLGLCL